MQITKNEIQIWSVTLDSCFTEEEKALLVLSQDEIKRANRFHSRLHRLRFIVARSTLRAILSKYLSVSANCIKFAYTKYGKPYIKSPAHIPITFNLSHSENVAIYAFSLNHQIGIDIENINHFCPMEVAKRYFSLEEQAELNQLSGQDKIKNFYRIWTRKEAIIKAIGKGLSIPLTSFSVSSPHSEMLNLYNQNWSLLSLSLYENYQTALAFNFPTEQIKIKYHPYS